MRAFLAVPVSGPAASQWGQLIARLEAVCPGVRWAQAAPHITLRFFARLEAERVEELMTAVAVGTRAVRTWTATLERGGAFPSWRSPRVVWVGIGAGASELAELARRVDDSLARSGFGAADRAFRAHCTLGRPPDGWSAEERRECRQRLSELALPAFTADRVVLVESRLCAGPARHVPLAEVRLT